MDWQTELSTMKKAVFGGEENFLPPAFLLWNPSNNYELYVSSFDEGVFEVHFSRPIDEHEVAEFVSQRLNLEQVHEILLAFANDQPQQVCTILSQADTPNGQLYQFLRTKQISKRQKWYYSGRGLRVVILYFAVAGLLAFLASQNFYTGSPWKLWIWGGAAIFIFLSLAAAETMKKNKNY